MEQDREKISALAAQVMSLAHDDILIHLRFFDVALSRLKCRERRGLDGFAMAGEGCLYDPVSVLKCYQRDRRYPARVYLHMLLHAVFFHSFRYDKLEEQDWNLAADIAVENVILEMAVPCAALEEDERLAGKLRVLKEEIGSLTAERIYRYFRRNPLSAEERSCLQELFFKDGHQLWRKQEQLEVTAQQWKKISERVKADIGTFTKAAGGADALGKNLEEVTRGRYDYTAVLRRFMVMGEDIAINEEEFDNIYYTYGLAHYGNLPLIEPLEYRELMRVREFVIAIDTSASCRGPLVQAFLRKTYSILAQSENFFHKIKLHLIQCDNTVQKDTTITSQEDFEAFLREGKLYGFGATDFRPVFEYVDSLKASGAFENLKGLIYFTDGYGIYPERMPDYEVVFAFVGEDENRRTVPPWSIKVVLEEEELDEAQ